MKTYNNLYETLYSLGNLTLAWRNAREGKTKTLNIIEFEKNLQRNLLQLHYELKNKTYKPRPLTTFVLRDPKTRVISKSDFRDRVVHHALILIIGHIFEKQFIYDSCANQKEKGTLFALKRLDYFIGKICKGSVKGFCLKADIKHYFQEIDHEVLLKIINKKITDKNTLWLIRQILNNTKSINWEGGGKCLKGMPLGNLTSQFFANVYLNEFDKFVKHELRTHYYIRYVDDFIILHKSKKQLEIFKEKIDKFLSEKLKIKLHPQKSRIIPISRGIDFVGFRNFYCHRLLRARNIKSMRKKINLFKKGIIGFCTLFEIYQGWQAYAKWANTHKLREKIKKEIINVSWDKIKFE